MATKTISITEDAYERLASKKKENESFSEIINRLTNKISLLDLAGLLTDEEAKKLENKIKRYRNISRIKMSKIKNSLKTI